MVLVQPTAADLLTVRRFVTQNGLEKWASRCSAQCVSDFNASAGKLLRIAIKQP